MKSWDYGWLGTKWTSPALRQDVDGMATKEAMFAGPLLAGKTDAEKEGMWTQINSDTSNLFTHKEFQPVMV